MPIIRSSRPYCVITAYGVQCLGFWLSEIRCRAAGCASGMKDVARSSNIPRSGLIAGCPAPDILQPATKHCPPQAVKTQYCLELLMMGIEVPVTYHKCNKAFSDIQLVFLLYAHATTHGQRHIKFKCRVLFQNKINLRYCASGQFYYRKKSLRTVFWFGGQNSLPVNCTVRLSSDQQLWPDVSGSQCQTLSLIPNCTTCSCNTQKPSVSKASLQFHFIVLNSQHIISSLRVYCHQIS